MTTNKIQSEVNIRQSNSVFLIEVKDGHTDNVLAVTRDELEKIVSYGQVILNNKEL